jgi:hypothetical protein
MGSCVKLRCTYCIGSDWWGERGSCGRPGTKASLHPRMNNPQKTKMRIPSVSDESLLICLFSL